MVQGVLSLCPPGSQVHSPKLSCFSVLPSTTFPLGVSLWTKVLFVFSKGLWKSIVKPQRGQILWQHINSSLLRSQAEVWAQRLGGELSVNVTTRTSCWCSQVKIPTPHHSWSRKILTWCESNPRDKAGTEIHCVYQADGPESQLWRQGDPPSPLDDCLMMPGSHSVLFPCKYLPGVGLEMKWAPPQTPIMWTSLPGQLDWTHLPPSSPVQRASESMKHLLTPITSKVVSAWDLCSLGPLSRFTFSWHCCSLVWAANLPTWRPVPAQPFGELKAVDQGTACPWSLHGQEADVAKALEKWALETVGMGQLMASCNLSAVASSGLVLSSPCVPPSPVLTEEVRERERERRISCLGFNRRPPASPKYSFHLIWVGEEYQSKWEESLCQRRLSHSHLHCP